MQKQRIGNKASVFGQAARVDMGSTWERTSSPMDRGERGRSHLSCMWSQGHFCNPERRNWSRMNVYPWKKSKLRKSQPYTNKRLIMIYNCFSYRVNFFSKMFVLFSYLFVFHGDPLAVLPAKALSWNHWENIVLMFSVESKLQGRRTPCTSRQECAHPFPPLWSILVITQ